MNSAIQFCFLLILMSGPLRITSGTVSTETTLVSSPRGDEVTCGIMLSEIFTVCGKESVNLAQRFLIC